jgi:hypothetical protein
MSGVFGGAFTLSDFEDRFLHFRASDGPLNPSGLPAVDADAVDQWLDLSGEGNHLTAFDAARRFAYDADGGPIGQPVCKSPADLLRRASLTGGTQVGFTMIILGRWNTTDYGAGDRVVAGDTTPAFQWASQSATITGTPPDATSISNVLATSGNSGNVTGTPIGDWMLFVMECRDGVVAKGYWAFNDAIPTLMSGAPTAFELDAFAMGATYANTGHANFDFLEVCFLRRPTFAQEDWNLVRGYAAKQLGKTFADTKRFLDTFQRANTSDNNLGLSDTNCGWRVTGSGATSARLYDNALTNGTPGGAYGTFYASPNITFSPSVMEWDFEMRTGPGAGLDSTNAVGLSANLDDINDMIHMVWGKTQIRIERFNPGGVGTVVVASVPFGGTVLEGRVKVEFDFANGLVHVTVPNGTRTTLDWDSVQARPLSDYNTRNTFVEVISGGDETLIAAYTRVYMRK